MSKWPLDFMALQFGVEIRPDRNAGARKSRRSTPIVDPADQAADARALVEEWNRRVAAGIDPQYSPTIGCAILANRPFLRLLCHGCRQYADLDLRKVVRPGTFAINVRRASNSLNGFWPTSRPTRACFVAFGPTTGSIPFPPNPPSGCSTRRLSRRSSARSRSPGPRRIPRRSQRSLLALASLGRN